uniref:DUF4704 domain-containing protein n=1 Tax=Rhabditophanes sp. KR3021 TaxID=114890 RepID=A0AC35TY91_9BILA
MSANSPTLNLHHLSKSPEKTIQEAIIPTTPSIPPTPAIDTNVDHQKTFVLKADINDQEMLDVDLDGETGGGREVNVTPTPESCPEDVFEKCHNLKRLSIASDSSDESVSNFSKSVLSTTSSKTIVSSPTIKNTPRHIIQSNEETVQETISRLKLDFKTNTITSKDCIYCLFNLLVSGIFDLETKFIIEKPPAIDGMLELLDEADSDFQAQVWLLFSSVVKKSFINLEACSEVGLISKLLDRLPQTENTVSDLIIQLLSVLSSYSITVKETKRFLRALHATNGVWPRHSVKLLSVMKEMPKKDIADVFFSFPGKQGSGLALPPLSKWPYQNGWSFSTFLRMDPKNGTNFEKETPYLFYFGTQKGIGYAGYFMGSCLVITSMKGEGASQKNFIKCIAKPLTPRRWHHIALSFNYSRWAKSEILVFLDGGLVETVEANWSVHPNEHYDRCFIGSGPKPDENEAFSGQMCAVYVFSQSITPEQAHSLYFLGPEYQSYFKHDAESNLKEGYKKHLFDGTLNSSMIMAYCPKNCHEQLCLMPSNRTSASQASSGSQAMSSYFVQVPHAIMRKVKVITTHSIHSSLHSVGGIQMLLPLFAQIDMLHADQNTMIDYEICSTLLNVIFLLLGTSNSAQQQLYHSKGFLIIAHTLNTVSKAHLTGNVLNTLLSIAKFLSNGTGSGKPLLKHLIDHILLNPQLWIRAQPHIQIQLYKFLNEQGFGECQFGQVIRRTPAVLELIHAIKMFYWVEKPKANDTYSVPDTSKDGLRPLKKDILMIRQLIISLIDKLIFPDNASQKDGDRKEEFEAIFNFIATVEEPENVCDVLAQAVLQIANNPAIMIPIFDRNNGLCVIFHLMTSPNDLIRIPALKILGFFLCRSTLTRKTDSIYNQNLLSLIGDKILLNTKSLTRPCYNVLYEIMTEEMQSKIMYQDHSPPTANLSHFENQQMLKVITNIIIQSVETPELMAVKKTFLVDIIALVKNSKDNRRIILQMSVWQEWLMSLAYIYPKTGLEHEISDMVYDLFKILLSHAIHYEFGGWRVWVDTLAISHAKVSWVNHHKSKQNERDEDGGNAYITPDYSWSHVQLRLLDDLLTSVEGTLQEVKNMDTMVVDFIQGAENQILVTNTIHVITQLSDTLIMACGGLLPLLAAATSPNSELQINDTSSHGISIDDAAGILQRFGDLIDDFVFLSAIPLSELEVDKNLPQGAILRQVLRLLSCLTVRNILACRIHEDERPSLILPPEGSEGKCFVKAKAIQNFVKDLFPDYKNAEELIKLKPHKHLIPDPESLIQKADLARLKHIVYRDMEEIKQAQYLCLTVVYFLSVLMVSRYRDILEPKASPSPFFSSSNAGVVVKNDGQAKESNGAGGVDGSSNSDTTPPAKPAEIASINVNAEKPEMERPTLEDTKQLSQFNNSEAIKSINTNKNSERQAYLTDKLKKSLDSSAPLLREIINDFRSFLQKNLVGTHGQEILNDERAMALFKNANGSVVEIVMLLCSQEWQTSLQKHAGLALMECLTESRLMAQATKEHILRVATEADFILNRLRAEDVSKHTAFEKEADVKLNEKKSQEKVFDHMIKSARRRETLIATKMLENMKNMLVSHSGKFAFKDI